ncbi:energy-coupling factor transporter transmembrane component T [Spiroplasma endosymbiont of Crioceris asparagi]|uniref:energy-coupling factor transporter transmembrane component T family protein n=1 Tax=Spiroplasma endosymbiont of Crioceris asparagi TaxID=3066286 RepID=UPI0030D3C19F
MRMVFGRYIPGNSLIHKLDPRLKLFLIISLIVSLFIPIGALGLSCLGLFIICLYVISGLKWKMLSKLVFPILFIFIVLLIISTITKSNPDGGEVGKTFNVWILHISEQKIYQAVYMTLRIFFMILLTTILTGTTQPLVLTLAIEDLLKPLQWIKFPVFIFSMIISIALRMIPTLIDEAGRIMKAQASRGVDFKNGKLRDKVKTLVSLIIPLLVSSFQKAEDLAYAMDSRGYDPGAKRTRYRQFKFSIRDLILFLIGMTVVVLLFVYAYNTQWQELQIPRVDTLLGKLSYKKPL